MRSSIEAQVLAGIGARSTRRIGCVPSSPAIELSLFTNPGTTTGYIGPQPEFCFTIPGYFALLSGDSRTHLYKSITMYFPSEKRCNDYITSSSGDSRTHIRMAITLYFPSERRSWNFSLCLMMRNKRNKSCLIAR